MWRGLSMKNSNTLGWAHPKAAVERISAQVVTSRHGPRKHRLGIVSELGKGRKPVQGALTSRLLIWATGARPCWGPLGDHVEHTSKLPPPPQGGRKRGHLANHSPSSQLACPTWGQERRCCKRACQLLAVRTLPCLQTWRVYQQQLHELPPIRDYVLDSSGRLNPARFGAGGLCS